MNEVKLDINSDTPDSVWNGIEEIVKTSFLPELTYGDDRPSTQEDFTLFKGNIERWLNVVNRGLLRLFHMKKNWKSSPDTNFETFEFRRDVAVWTLLLFGEHSQADLWTTAESCRLAAESTGTLCQLCNCDSLSQLLAGTTAKSLQHIFKQALICLRPKLLKETWQRYPGAVASYRWMLTHVYTPHLSEYLYLVLPTALIIVDDHTVERRLIGLTCLSHIVSNVARTELCQQGFQDVIFKALEHILFLNDSKQIEPTMVCLTKLLQMVERGYTRSAEPGMWDRFDDILKLILHKMSLEDQIPLRKAYIKSLNPLICAMGPPVIRWSKLLISVIDEYLHRESFDTRCDALQVLLTYMQLASPRIISHGNEILFLLLRTLHDVSIDEKTCAEPELSFILETIVKCLLLLKECGPGKFNSVEAEISSMECNSLMKDTLVRVFLSK